MTEEKKLSDDELKDIAGGVKTYNTSKSNTSAAKPVEDDKNPTTTPTKRDGFTPQ